MGRFKVKIDLTGLDTVQLNLNKVSKAIKDIRPALKKVANDIRETEDKVFMAEGAYGSRAKWRKLSPNYKHWKSMNFPGKPILQQTGALRQSLIYKGNSNHIETITKTSLTYGSKDPKFSWHQTGNTKLPKRPPLTYTKYQGVKWSKIIRDDIMGRIK